MQATLAFTARPLAVRRAAAQTSRRNALVVRAEKKDVTRYVYEMNILTHVETNTLQCGPVCKAWALKVSRVTDPREGTNRGKVHRQTLERNQR